MTDRRPPPPALEGAILHALASPAWVQADDDVSRARLLLDVISRALRASGLPGCRGGEQLADAYRRVLRDQQIRDTFDGTNTLDLAARHRLTVRQVRRIVAPRRRRK